MITDDILARLFAANGKLYLPDDPGVLDAAIVEIERLQKAIAAERERCAKIVEALEMSVKLQSHYASLLNNYDGGKRMTFKDADAWMCRLAAIRKSAP